ncbi:hypothetical protein [Nitrobacter sp. TKz-YC02]|uniref:hypothetical protein n=1 Tax=Nitrobacter sp. TKz-YC02 TaxID=3398704 RepID=UPI003CE6927E
MSAAMKLFEALDVRCIPLKQARRRGPMETHAVNIVDRMIRQHGLPHATLTLRTITESEGNQGALIADVIEAVSDVIRHHPRWANLGLEWLAAFDSIRLIDLRRKVKAAKVRPLKAGIATLICVELEKILGPSVLPKPPKPVRAKTEQKPPASLTRVPCVEKNIALGLQLLALRSANKSNGAFGRAVRRQFDIDGQQACEVMKVARVYGGRPEIYSRISWNALLHLASPALSASAREALERRIIAGERIGAPEIRAARGALKSGRPLHPPDQPAQWMAARSIAQIRETTCHSTFPIVHFRFLNQS